MNRTFSPVLSGAQIQGTGMKHPRVPKVIIGSELNGFVQGDLMDANAISQYIAEKISTSGSNEDITELKNKILSLQSEDETIRSLIRDVIDDINNLGVIEEHLQDLQTVQQKLQAIEVTVQQYIENNATVVSDENGDLIGIIS
jgi:cell fate (sporulation/competence/biofilm development) regulator YmcA (YheA/YmcA/DUF963 family)